MTELEKELLAALKVARTALAAIEDDDDDTATIALQTIRAAIAKAETRDTP